jgi:HJR/Mrr/RecB family endonuclease
MDQNELIKPKKPKLEDFDLNDEKLKLLSDLKLKCKKKENWYIMLLFIALNIIFIVIIFSSPKLDGALMIFSFIVSGITAGGVFPNIFKKISGSEIKDFIFKLNENELISKIQDNNSKLGSALIYYKKENDHYENNMRRVTWQYWFALSPLDFEEAVGQLFHEKGYEVKTTAYSGDNGVDLFLWKDEKKYVVQCKTYKKVLGPNTVRDLYGTMTAEGAQEAFLVAPSGFSKATKQYCIGKPIKLMDIDDLTKMTHDFESYTPYWIDNAKSIDELMKGVRKI